MTDFSDSLPVAARTIQTGLRRDVKVLTLILQDRRGRKRYERMLNAGWTVDAITHRTLSRAVTVTFSRIHLSRRDRRFISGKAARS